jgi:uncharacterized protein YjdB
VNITATVQPDNVKGTLPMRVLVPIASISLTASVDSLLPAGTATMTAVARDQSGNAISGRPFTWSATGSVSVNTTTTGSTNTATASSTPGSGNVSVSAEGKSTAHAIRVLVPVASVTVALASTSIQVGQTSQATATIKDAGGNPVGGRQLTWSSSDPSVATVSASGLVTGVATGSATITGTVPLDGKSGVSPALTVTAATTPIARVDMSVTPADSLLPAASATATATPRDAGGNPVQLGPGQSLVWASSNTSVATVSQAGVITAVAPGNADITATVQPDNVKGTLPMRVLVPIASITLTTTVDSLLPAGTATLTATARDQGGNPISGRPFTWSATGSVTVNQAATGATNTATASSTPGSGNVSVSAEGKSASQAIRVLVPVSSVDVALASTSIQVGQTSQATATPKDGSGSPVAGRQVTWSSSDPSVATVNASGLVTGVAAGNATITATVPLDGKSGVSPQLTVTPASTPVATVDMSVTPADSLLPTASATVTATPLDAGGNPVQLGPGQSLVWASSNTSVASVTQAGVVTAVAPGTADITATVQPDNVTGTLPMRVLAPVTTVNVTLSTDSIDVGQTSQATAALEDASGSPVVGRQVTWSSSDPNVATVDASGLVTGVAAGSVTITASVPLDGVSGTSPSLTVAAPAIPIDSVVFQPDSLSMQQQQTRPAKLTVQDAQGKGLGGRACVVTTLDPTIVLVAPKNGTPASSFNGVTDPHGHLDVDVASNAVAGSANVEANCEGTIGILAVTVQ